MVKSNLLFVCLCLFLARVQAQQLLNGNFEINNAGEDLLNISNGFYNGIMASSVAFGTSGNIDVIKSDSFCGAPQSGDWYIALTGGGTDAVSLELSSALVPGAEYQLSFYDKTCFSPIRIVYPVQVGLSNSPTQFGTQVYIGGLPATTWTLRTFVFTAASPSQYITLKLQGGDTYNAWAHVDNFSISCINTINLGRDTTLCNGEVLQLGVDATNQSIQWSDGSNQPFYTVNRPGSYWVNAINAAGCPGADTVIVSYKACNCNSEIANAFSPNGDGINDYWCIATQDCKRTIRLTVFDRYGRQVFHSENYTNNWNGTYRGKPLAAATYYYMARAIYENGTISNLSGSVTILR